MWKQHELWDGTYTISDWLEIIYRATNFKEEKYKFWAKLITGVKHGR